MTCAAEPTPLADSLRRLETLVSPLTGVIHEAWPLLTTTGDARFPSVGCRLASTAGISGRELDANAGACHAHANVARAAALGEAVERYSASVVPHDELVLATADELGDVAVEPGRFALFRADQHAEPRFLPVPFTRATRLRWVRGYSLPDREEAWLPAQLVYLTSTPLPPGEELIAYSTSSGLACGPTLDEAILAGLLELVERDAFMLTWANRLSLPRLDTRSDAELTALQARYLAPVGVDYELVDLSVVHRVPTALAVVRGGAGDSVALAVGAASSPTAQDASRKAVCEATAVRVWARALRLAAPDRQFAPDFSDVATFADHVHLYALGQHAEAADFLTASQEVRPISEVAGLEGRTPAAWIDALLRRLEAAGTAAYVVDVTAPDVAAAGLRVARVVAPELCPLDVSHRARFLGGDRLYRAAWELGLRGGPLSPAEVNPFPHPFP